MKKYIIPAIAVIFILICVNLLLPAPEPNHCAICDSIPYHAPCLVNLATGWETHITVPINENEYEEKYFCKSCRELISSHTENGFLLLDLRTPESFTILPLRSGEIQRLRCYEIQTKETLNEIEIIVHGTFEIDDHSIVE